MHYNIKRLWKVVYAFVGKFYLLSVSEVHKHSCIRLVLNLFNLADCLKWTNSHHGASFVKHIRTVTVLCVGMCGNRILVFKNRTEAKRSNPKFQFPWLISKPNLSHTNSQYLSHSHKALTFFTLRTLSESKWSWNQVISLTPCYNTVNTVQYWLSNWGL